MRTMMSTASLFMLTIPVWMAIGCKSTEIGPPAINSDPVSCESYPQIAVTPELKDKLVAGEADVKSGPPMAVTVPVRAVEPREYRVEYRFWFLDEAGVPLNRKPDWHFIKVPQTQVFLYANASDHTARSWRLEIRKAAK